MAEDKNKNPITVRPRDQNWTDVAGIKQEVDLEMHEVWKMT